MWVNKLCLATDRSGQGTQARVFTSLLSHPCPGKYLIRQIPWLTLEPVSHVTRATAESGPFVTSVASVIPHVANPTGRTGIYSDLGKVG